MRTRGIQMTLALGIITGLAAISSAQQVTIKEDARTWTMDNGIVTAMVAKESGDLVSLRYKNLEMLATILKEDGTPDLDRDPPGENRAGLNRGMTDHQYGFWSHDAMGPRGTGDAAAKVTDDPKANGGKRAEVSVKGVSNGRPMGTGPGAGTPGNFIVDVEIRWSLAAGESGVYTYCVFDHKAEYAATSITEARFCAKLADMFDWMSVADDTHHNKHYPSTLREGDKYVYTTNQYKNPAFGWSSTAKNVGFFIINPSNEYMSGGPTKVEFLGHRDTNQVAAPCVLNYWRSSHYGGAEVSVAAGEQWTKVIGPFMLYVNSGADAQAIYKDARAQAAKEQARWPIDTVQHPDYPTSKDRATVTGTLVLDDAQAKSRNFPNLMVGLTAPDYQVSGGPGGGRVVSWQTNAKHYQFWVPGNENGTFSIPDVRPGTYTLRAFADGVLGELAQVDVTIQPGKNLNMGQVKWTPVRKGKQLWDVGIPNRNGSEFFKAETFWEPAAPRAYSDLFPNDVNFIVGKSDYKKDWYFQHVPHFVAAPPAPPPPPVDPAAPPTTGPARRGGRAGGAGFGAPAQNGRATPFTVTFEMPTAPKGKATLRLAIAGTGATSLDVAINEKAAGQVERLRGDGTISRHGSQGIWYEREFVFDAALLKQGTNTLTLVVPAGNVNNGMIYDYLRLELDETALATASTR